MVNFYKRHGWPQALARSERFEKITLFIISGLVLCFFFLCVCVCFFLVRGFSDPRRFCWFGCFGWAGAVVGGCFASDISGMLVRYVSLHRF